MKSFELREIKKELIEKYNIKSMDDKVPFKIANDFVADQFNAGWSHFYGFRDAAILMGFADETVKGNVKKKWMISYYNIFNMMHSHTEYYTTTPLYQKNLKKNCSVKNGFIDWSEK